MSPSVSCVNPAGLQLSTTPVVTEADLDRVKRALDFTNRVSNTSNCLTHQRRIQFATAHDADKAGVAVVPVRTAPAVEFVSGPGELGYDQTKVAHLSTRTAGTVWKVYKHLGQDVKAGDVLALVDAAEVGKTKAEVLQALATLQLKETDVLASIKESAGAVPAARVREVEASVREAEIRVGAGCQALSNLGLPLERVANCSALFRRATSGQVASVGYSRRHRRHTRKDCHHESAAHHCSAGWPRDVARGRCR